jgi:hypothetical protein
MDSRVLESQISFKLRRGEHTRMPIYAGTLGMPRQLPSLEARNQIFVPAITLFRPFPSHGSDTLAG